MADENSGPSVYHVSPLRQMLFLLPWGLIAIPMLIAGIVAKEPALFVVVLLISLIWSPLAYAVCIYTRLIISADGVDLRQLGYRLQSTWDNIDSLDRTPGLEGFVLREPLQGRGALRLASASGLQLVVGGASMPGYTGGRQDLVAQSRFIPIEPFAHWLKKGDLASVIAQHAPRLMDGSTPAPPPPAAAAPMSLGTKVMLTVTIAGSLALGLALATGQFNAGAEIWIYRILQGAMGVAAGVYAIVNLVNIVRHAKHNHWGWAFVSLLFAILAFCGMLVMFSDMP
jgi:hypothetical protein